MSKHPCDTFELELPRGAAKPVGTTRFVLGTRGVDFNEFCEAFNTFSVQPTGRDQTDLASHMDEMVRVCVVVHQDRSFEFSIRS